MIQSARTVLIRHVPWLLFFLASCGTALPLKVAVDDARSNALAASVALADYEESAEDAIISRMVATPSGRQLARDQLRDQRSKANACVAALAALDATITVALNAPTDSVQVGHVVDASNAVGECMRQLGVTYVPKSDGGTR